MIVIERFALGVEQRVFFDGNRIRPNPWLAISAEPIIDAAHNITVVINRPWRASPIYVVYDAIDQPLARSCSAIAA